MFAAKYALEKNASAFPTVQVAVGVAAEYATGHIVSMYANPLADGSWGKTYFPTITPKSGNVKMLYCIEL